MTNRLRYFQRILPEKEKYGRRYEQFECVGFGLVLYQTQSKIEYYESETTENSNSYGYRWSPLLNQSLCIATVLCNNVSGLLLRLSLSFQNLVEHL